MRWRSGAAAGGTIVVVALGGCGAASTRSPAAEQQQVRGTLQRFANASAAGDYASMCQSLLAGRLIAKIRSLGVPCELAVRTGLSSVKDPRLSVQSVRIDGDRASALVRSTAQGQRPSTDIVQLVREGGRWRVASLASG